MRASDARKTLGLGLRYTNEDVRRKFKELAFAQHCDTGSGVGDMAALRRARDHLLSLNNEEKETEDGNRKREPKWRCR